MYNLDTAVRELNFTVDLKEIKEYYSTLQTDYKHLHWSWEKNSIHLEENAKSACLNKEETIMHGWPLQSDMADPNIPPSMLKSKHARVDWYNTELMFGPIQRLHDAIPFSYRWTLFVLPPNGRVVKHTDANEYVVHLPIYWDHDALFILGDSPNARSYSLPATGKAYVVDVEIPHETVNNSNKDRVGLIFRIKRSNIDKLFAVKGHI
jgi:hypothetical protein